MMTKEITLRLRPDQIRTIRFLYPEVSVSVIARVLFDLFLEDPYAEDLQDSIHEESVRTNTAIQNHQFKSKRKEKTENEHRTEPPSLRLRQQLLRSLRAESGDSSL